MVSENSMGVKLGLFARSQSNKSIKMVALIQVGPKWGPTGVHFPSTVHHRICLPLKEGELVKPDSMIFQLLAFK